MNDNEITDYYITNQHDRPINAILAGSETRIQILKTCCERYRSQEEAQERLDYLRECTGKRLANLKVSTYIKF